MERLFNIYLDGIDGYDEWLEYPVDYVDTTEEIMMDDVRGGLEELGGGHADIYDAENDELFADIEV